MRAPRIPLTVIGGFLGAGKTTLLNHLLTQADGRRLAVLVNDFGAINLDRALIAAEEAGAIELTNGCVCCQIGDDLTAALIALIESPRPPDAIVVEASGVSDPWRIAQVGIADPALSLDGVIVLVDAGAVREQAADPLLADTVQRQLRAADLLVVNQCDRVDAASLAGLRLWLDTQVPGRPRFETIHGRVPAPLLGFAALHAGPALPVLGRSPRLKAGDPAHGAVFDTWALDDAPVFSARALRALLKSMPAGVLRLKGLVRTDEHTQAELQFAGQHGSLRAAADPSGRCSVVAIGLQGRLPSAALAQAFEAAAALPTPTLP
ncbi:MAG: cobalamin biosynthesis protein P47K [Variovorax paradoxus]|uniref:Cobalamin biosynthesis protein P47K n=1 Tax=Variovorax paradoxus TaxID=34073 RepID=A0A2W5QL01_VARPD|nr:MAG: cobalamin biosynthesis protein P47K [Variovorax paradoxus]